MKANQIEIEVEASAAILGQIEEARAAIALVLFEIDDIVLQINPQIESDYAVKIGYLENGLLLAQIAARRARRRVSLAQARVNEGGCIDESECDALLDEEFSAWESQLNEQISSYIQTLEDRFNSRPMTATQAKDLKFLHGKLVKRFHPDLNPQQGKDEKRFFLLAQMAYKAGDLETLKAISAATEGMERVSALDNNSSYELYAEYELTCAQLRVAQKQLDELKRANPYALGVKLADAEWVCTNVENLKLQIAEQNKAEKLCEERFRQLKEDGGYV